MIEQATEEKYLSDLPDNLAPGSSKDDASVAKNWPRSEMTSSICDGITYAPER